MSRTNWKKCFVLLLAGVLLLSACAQPAGTNGGADTTAPTQDTPTQEGDTPLGEVGHLLRNPAWAETLTIQLAGPGVREGVDYNDCDLSRYFFERFNIQWEMINLTWANWAEMLRIWISAGDVPDMATWDYVHGEAVLYARDGLVRRMPDDWGQRWPNAYAAVQASGIGPAVAEIVGGYYFLHKPIFMHNKPTDPLVGHNVIYMRRDWMEAVGAEIKPYYTMSEIIEIARLFRDQDPGGVGSALVPISMHSGMATMNFVGRQTALTDTRPFRLGPDGQYHWTPADPAILTGLQLYQEAFRDGLFHPDFFLWTSDEDVQNFLQLGVAGMMSDIGMSIIVQSHMQAMVDMGLSEDALHVAFIIGEDGYYHEDEIINFWTATIFSPDLPEADFERLMYLIDYTAETETQLTIRMGFEGTHWEREGNIIQTLLPPGTDMWDIFPSTNPLWGNFLVLSDDFVLTSPVIRPEAHDITNAMYALKDQLSTSQTVIATDWALFFQDSAARRMSNIDSRQVFTELIMMDGDLETNWQNWVDSQRSIIEPVLNELNAMR